VCNDAGDESRHALTGARGPFGVGGELNLAAAFVDGTNLLAQSSARTAASNSASNLEHAAAQKTTAQGRASCRSFL
jgi:hypothetical protein